MVNLENYSGFDKAAILLQILVEQLAMPLFNSISESEMLKLRVRSRELQNTPTAVKKLIMEEYYFKMMSNQYRNKPEPDDVFKFIRDLNDEQLFYLLSKEEVKIIQQSRGGNEDPALGCRAWSEKQQNGSKQAGRANNHGHGHKPVAINLNHRIP